MTNTTLQFPFSVITGRSILRLIRDDFEGCMDVVRTCYLAHAKGQSVNPPSFFLRFSDKPNARIIGLPSHLNPPWELSGIKWIASYPDNIQKGFPRASAVLILNSHDHGYPFACLEASIISASRTAASAALAAHHLNGGKRRTKALGIVGTGLIARYVYQFLLGTGWEIDAVRLHDLTSAQAQKFAKEVCNPDRHQDIEVMHDINSLLTSCDIVLFATVASTPHVHDPILFAHNPLVLHISLRDLNPELLLNAYNIVDDIDHVMHADTSPHLAEKLSGGRAFVSGTLADVMTGRCSVNRSKPIIFSPFGLGVLDLAVGKWIYERAVRAGQQLTIDDFFYDMER
jgi:ornithine cyclodeaminase